MLIILRIAILAFVVMEASNIVIMYVRPDFPYGNSMRTFRQWYKAQGDEPSRLFVKYMVRWVANCKLIFLVLLIVVVIVGNEISTVCAVIATVVSIGIYFVSLHPIIKKLDQMDEIQPKGYSKTLALIIGAFMAMFSLALLFYFLT